MEHMEKMKSPRLISALLSAALWHCVNSNDGVKPQDCEANPLIESAGSPSDAELQHCVDVVNGYRDSVSLPHLARSPALEAFAAIGACWDSHSKTAHSHFSAKADYTLTDAENELPGWSLGWIRTITAIVDQGTKMMWDEGPGTGSAHGHYNNIVGNQTSVGCGIYVAADSTVWVTQDFK